uniref:AlNc14C27G2618 protein n=1 Tax=Albugo laibachii Nc14 TaxID=890382 RepID=F0W6Y2_9STRA|nr:AlNc14C27G2618 [Albugo laibachii Nc14]|eukprot:CCA16877.1 AlNc14C27G2618 [Albugo laibachii Nc14]
MEMFAMHLACLKEDVDMEDIEELLAKKTIVDDKLLEMARTLEKHCLTRVKEGASKEAALCTKGGLLLFMEHFYTTATTPTDYQDAELLFLKQGLSVSVNNVLLLRLIRVKTSEEQNLSLYPNRDTFAKGPVHVLAGALLMQSAPCISLLPQLTITNNLKEHVTAASILLMKLLGGGCHVKAGIKQETHLCPPPLELQGSIAT